MTNRCATLLLLNSCKDILSLKLSCCLFLTSQASSSVSHQPMFIYIRRNSTQPSKISDEFFPPYVTGHFTEPVWLQRSQGSNHSVFCSQAGDSVKGFPWQNLCSLPKHQKRHPSLTLEQGNHVEQNNKHLAQLKGEIWSSLQRSSIG